VKVDTTNKDGSALATSVRQQAAYSSNALAIDLAPVNQLITDIVRANAG